MPWDSEALGEKSLWLAVAHHSQLPTIDCSKPQVEPKEESKQTRRALVWNGAHRRKTLGAEQLRRVIQSSNPTLAPESKQPAHKATFSSHLWFLPTIRPHPGPCDVGVLSPSLPCLSDSCLVLWGLLSAA